VVKGKISFRRNVRRLFIKPGEDSGRKKEL
jgi:hypothetical protein